MTNEDLVKRIQSGQAEYITQLWRKVVKFIDMMAGRYLDGWPEHYRQLQPDMVNESYFYFLQAIEKYEPDKGTFINYLAWHLKNPFETALQGRGQRLKNEPLNSAVSLDMPLSDSDDYTLADTLIDETSEVYHRRIEDMDFWKSVGRFLEDAIDHVNDHVGGEIIRYMYHNGGTIKEASFALYGDIPIPYERYRKAMRQLYHYMHRSIVKNRMALIGLDDYIYYYGNGLQSYRHRLFTSTVEHAAIRRADASLKLADMKRIFIQ